MSTNQPDTNIYYEKGLYCCGCECNVQPELVYGSHVYPNRHDLRERRFWKCLGCGNFVGCHPKSDRPLGCIPTPELKKARQHIHALIDPLWKSGKIHRGDLYKKMSEATGRKYHTAYIRSVEEAREVWKIASRIAQEVRGQA